MIKEVKFRIELGLVHKEFINGKKNGKINKIIKTSGCKIIFLENLNAYNMIIDTIHPIPSRVLEGLEMLEVSLTFFLIMIVKLKTSIGRATCRDFILRS
jgi:hypothetical protein